MKPEQQRIKIAEFCGWQAKQDGTGWLYFKPCGYINGKWVEGYPAGFYALSNAGPLPDYLNDLNAMHEAEKMLNSKQSSDYEDFLVKRAADELGKIQCFADGYSFHATAAQRAEAFLRAIGKWEEEA